MLNMKLLIILLISMLVSSVIAKVNPAKSILNKLKKTNKRAGYRGQQRIKTRKADSYGYSSPAPIPHGFSTPGASQSSSSYGAPVSTYSTLAPSSYGTPDPSSYGSPTPSSYGSPSPSSYGSPQGSHSTNDDVDLHNKEFCVDVSIYQPVVWVERDGEECKTDFVKQCEDKSENVCADVTETSCEVSRREVQ